MAIYEKADITDINDLIDMRIAYLQEDMGIDDEDVLSFRKALSDYYEKHLNHDLSVFSAKENGEMISCAFLVSEVKPPNPRFPQGRAGTVFNVYTKPEFRHQGHGRRVMTMLIREAENTGLSQIELKATKDGFHLYESLGFQNESSAYTSMRLPLNR